MAAIVQPLAIGQSVALPAKGLERVFIGLGWKNIPGGKTVDLDCCVAGYGKAGDRDEQSTVWYGKLRNNTHKSKKEGSSIVHTGDVLKGQDDVLKEENDAERIYVWLTEVPDDLMTLAFAADIFTGGLTFSDLTSAYVRLVNADTNQELVRMSLSAADLGAVASSKVVLLSRIRRIDGGCWVLDSAVEARPKTLKEESGPQPDMAAVVVTDAVAVAPAAPVAVGVAVAPVAAAPAGAEADPKKKKRSGKAWACPALAVATGAGVVAATAIFMSSDASPLSSGMLEGSLFTSGVDFGSCVPPDLSGAADFFGGGLEVAGGVLSGAGEALGSAAGAAAGAIGSAVDGAGCGPCGAPCGGCGGVAGDVVEKAGDVVEAVVDAAGNIVGNVGELASGAAGAVGSVASGAAGAVSTVASGAAGAVGSAVGSAGEMASSAAGAAAGAASYVVNNAGEIASGAGTVAMEVGGKVVGAAGEVVKTVLDVVA